MSAWSLYTQDILLVELAAVLLLVALLGALLLARRPRTEAVEQATGHKGKSHGSNQLLPDPGRSHLHHWRHWRAYPAATPSIIFMCVEMMLNSVNLTLIALSRQWNNLNGQVFVFMIMAVAAAEVAVGLAILIAH